MQSASNNFSQEITGGNVVWAKPRVFADWDRTGYGADGSIDDLSAQVGDSFTISHHLDDGLPDAVSLVSGLGSPDMETPLAYGRGDYGPANRRASTYFSPYNTTSPVSGFDRDVAPVKLDWGLITANGPEYVRLFTGQMSNIPVKGQSAELHAMSATRNRLRKLIQPPAVIGDQYGLNATWAIVWALVQAGMYVSPPPRSGCRWWAPMHGSLRHMLPFDNTGTATKMSRVTAGGTVQIRPTFIPGPYMLGTDCKVTPSEVRYFSDWLQGGSGALITSGSDADILSKAGSTGRIEFWVKGDPANFNTAPGGSGNYPSNYVAFTYSNSQRLSIGQPFSQVQFGMQSDRRMFLSIQDGSGTNWQVATTAPLPTDGNWYFVGASWDLSNTGGSVMAIREFNGTTSYYTAGPTTTNLPARDDPLNAVITSYLPIAEVQLSTGPSVSLANAVTWLADPGYSWSVGATIRPSILELVALAETTPREIWEFLGSLAQAELATMRTDELDRFNYLPMSYWAESAQQAAVDAYSTSTNMADIDVDADPSKIRNRVSVDYSETRVNLTYSNLLEYRDVREIPPGISTLKLAFDKPALEVGAPNGTALYNATAGDVTAGPIGTYCTVNSSRDGTGGYQDSTSVQVVVTAWDPGSVTLTITNNSGATQYFANNGNGVSTISITGTSVTSNTASAVGVDSASVTKRGERGMSVSLPAIQRSDNAQAIANELAVRLAKPRATVSNVSLFPDPRRQPGDLVTLTDAVNTMASGLWRPQSITHTRSGDSYTQTATARQAMPAGRWDVDGWDNFVWGP